MKNHSFNLRRVSLILTIAVLLSSLIASFHYHELNSSHKTSEHCGICLASHDFKSGVLPDLVVAPQPVLFSVSSFRFEEKAIVLFSSSVYQSRAPPRS